MRPMALDEDEFSEYEMQEAIPPGGPAGRGWLILFYLLVFDGNVISKMQNIRSVCPLY